MADDFLINFVVNGAGEAKAAAQGVSGAVGDVGKQAESGGGGLANMTSGLVGFAAKAGLAAAAVKVLKIGFDEIAEDEAAEIHLRKVGLSADAAKKAMDALEDIELFTGDKVAAAQLYGDVINGKTRALKELGIELAETATMEEKLAVIQQLRARGTEVDAARIGTFTGEVQRLKRELENFAGDEVKRKLFIPEVTAALSFFNTKVLGLNAELPKLAKEQIATAEAAKRAAAAAKQEADGETAVALAVVGLTKALNEKSVAAQKAQAAMAEADDAETNAAKAKLAVDEARGDITKDEAESRRRALDFEQEERRLLAKKSALDAREEDLNKEEDKARAIERPLDRLGGVTRDDPAAKERVKESEALLAKVAEERAALEQERKNLENRKRENELNKEAGDLNQTAETIAREKENTDRLRKAAGEFADELEEDQDKINKRRREKREKEAEEARRADEKDAEQRRKGFEKLNEKLAAGEKERDGVERSPRDSRGRRKIISPKSDNELAPLPQRNPEPPLEIIIGKADDAAGKTKEAVNATGKSLDNLAGSVGAHTAAVDAFAAGVVARLDAQERNLAQLARQVRANVA